MSADGFDHVREREEPDCEPIGRVRRKLKSTGEARRAAKGLLKEEPVGKEGRTFQWTPMPGEPYSEWERVYDPRALNHFRSQPQRYEIQENLN